MGTDDLGTFDSSMRCMCGSDLVPSGQEPHRFVCSKCSQNYLAVMQLVPVPPRPLLLSQGLGAESSPGAK
jgi:hypothetical protein